MKSILKFLLLLWSTSIFACGGFEHSSSDGCIVLQPGTNNLFVSNPFCVNEQHRREREKEEELRALREENVRLRGQQRTLRVVSHDIKADLGTAILAVEAGCPEEGEAFLNRMDRTIRFVEGGPEDVAFLHYDVGDPINESVQTIRKMLRGRSIKAEGLVCSALMALMKDRVLQGYRSELDCVLGQLTRNATRFVKSGSIEVRADQKLPLNDANQVGIEFSVMDTGSGIASNDLEVIFQDGRQGSNLKGQCGGEHSSGIGLCRAKEAVNKMGGNLTVMSEVGKGSVFSFIVLMDTALRLKN